MFLILFRASIGINSAAICSTRRCAFRTFLKVDLCEYAAGSSAFSTNSADSLYNIQVKLFIYELVSDIEYIENIGNCRRRKLKPAILNGTVVLVF